MTHKFIFNAFCFILVLQMHAQQLNFWTGANCQLSYYNYMSTFNNSRFQSERCNLLDLKDKALCRKNKVKKVKVYYNNRLNVLNLTRQVKILAAFIRGTTIRPHAPVMLKMKILTWKRGTGIRKINL